MDGPGWIDAAAAGAGRRAADERLRELGEREGGQKAETADWVARGRELPERCDVRGSEMRAGEWMDGWMGGSMGDVMRRAQVDGASGIRQSWRDGLGAVGGAKPRPLQWATVGSKGKAEADGPPSAGKKPSLDPLKLVPTPSGKGPTEGGRFLRLRRKKWLLQCPKRPKFYKRITL